MPVLMALIQRAAVVVGTDTGPTHIAAAMGVPVVSVSPTKFVKSLRWGPWRTRNRVVSFSSECSLVCSPYRCRRTDCLTAIPASAATRAVQQLLEPGDEKSDPRMPSKHHWMRTSLHTMVYWSGRSDQIDTVIAQVRSARVAGYVVRIGVSRWRYRRRLADMLKTVGMSESVKISVLPIYDWLRLARYLMTYDITVVFVVGPVVGWFWFILRQICALRQYCPPVVVPVGEAADLPDSIDIRIVQAFSR
ncbi:hypothetical protein EBR96_10780 [bacterium]|nr:hypothetical protein [bacterium]